MSPSPADRSSRALAEACERARRYVETIRERAVAPSAEACARLAELARPFPADGAEPSEVLRVLDELGSAATTANTGGRYFGFVVGGTLPAALAAHTLAGAWDQVAGMRLMSPIAAALEEVAGGWLREVLGLPEGCRAGFVSGATMANLTGLASARHALLARAGWDVESRGLFGAPPFDVVVGGEVHVSLRKALGLLGLGRDRVVVVPADEQGRMRPDALPGLERPALLCLQAGNVNSGAFDPAAELCELAQRSGSWVHVDGAFGLWARASTRRAHLARGIELADSWVVDAHKWLNVPYDSGLVFVRDAAALAGAMRVRAPYLDSASELEPAEATPQMSRRARGIEVWAALASLGRSGLEELIERCCRHARRFADGLAAAGHEVLNDVVLNQVLVSFGTDDDTQRVLARIQEDGTCWCGGTHWHGRSAVRISVSSWATTDEDVERSLAAMLRAATSA